MGKIKKLKDVELVGGTEQSDVYPITSTKAIYDENNKRLDSIISELQKSADSSLETENKTIVGSINELKRLQDTGYLFKDVATPTTDPGAPKAKVFYIANGKGTYTNFGGLEVTEDEVVVLYWDTAWHKVSTGIASQAKLSELESEIKLDINSIEENLFSITQANEYNGHLDSSNKIVAWRQSKFIALRINPQDIIELSYTIEAAYMLVKSFEYEPTLPYTPDFCDGEVYRAVPKSGKIITAPLDANFILLRKSGPDGENYLPSNITINGYNIFNGLTKNIEELSDRINLVNSEITKIPISISEQHSYNGWIDSSNEIVQYGTSKYVVIDVEGRKYLRCNKKNSVRDGATFFIVKDFTFNPSLPYTPDLADGETGRRNIKVESIIYLPENAKYILLAVENSIGEDIIPEFFIMDGYDYVNDIVSNIADLKSKIEKVSQEKNYLPIKPIRTYNVSVGSQGIAVIGDKILGFSAGAEDHTTNNTVRVFNVNDITTSIGTMQHNLGHANGVDYCNETDTLITTSSENKSTATHSPNLYLVGNMTNKVANFAPLEYNGNDTICIPITNLNGLYTGMSCFGETPNIIYLATIQDPDKFYELDGRWIYKIFLGMGSNDMTVIHPENSYGTYITGKSENEYNGTAYLMGVYPFNKLMELQGGKYINGRIIFPTDINVDGIQKAYIVSVEIDYELSKANIVQQYCLPEYKGDGTFYRVESEDCVVVDGKIFQQLIIHSDNYIPRVWEYYMI